MKKVCGNRFELCSLKDSLISVCFNTYLYSFVFLPPAYVVRREGNVFSLSTRGGDTPWSLAYVLYRGGGTLFRSQDRGTPPPKKTWDHTSRGTLPQPGPGQGVTPPPSPDSTCYRQDTPRAVHLLRSSRRTFFLSDENTPQLFKNCESFKMCVKTCLSFKG